MQRCRRPLGLGQFVIPGLSIALSYFPLVAAMLLPCGISAQTTMTTFDGFTPTGLAPDTTLLTFSPSKLENFSPFNGTMQVNVPLVHIGGRGEAGLDLILRVQPTWEEQVVSQSQVTGYVGQYIVSSGGVPDGVFSDVLLPETVMAKTGILYGPCPDNSKVQCGEDSVTRLNFVGSDGSQTELVDTNLNGEPQRIMGWSAANPPTCWDDGRGTVFTSRDGHSTLTFVADARVQACVFPSTSQFVSGLLYFPNGSKYRFDNGALTYIEDRNGNKMAITTTSSGGAATTSISDSMGRSTTITGPTSLAAGPVTISYPGYQKPITISTSTLGSTLRADFASDVASLGSQMGCAAASTPVISSVTSPDGSTVTFQYGPWANIARINFPGGGAVEYDYAAAGQCNTKTGPVPLPVYFPVTERREYSDGTHLSSKTDYSIAYVASASRSSGYNDTITTETVTDPASNAVISQTAHKLTGSAHDWQYGPISFNPWDEGFEYETDFGSPVLKRITRQQNQSQMSWCTSSGVTGCTTPDGPANNPHLSSEIVTLADTNQQSKVTYQYDTYNNVTDKQEYDWGSGSPGSLVRETRTQYMGSPYTSQNILDLPSLETILNGSGTIVAETHYGYDEYNQGSTGPLNDAPNIVGHDPNYGTSFTTRGNLTNPATCLNAPSCTSWVNHVSDYDIAGNVVRRDDANANHTWLYYNDDGANKYAFPTSIKNAYSQFTRANYDYNIGKPTSVTDFNGIQTVYSFNDPLDRLTQVRHGAGTAAEAQTNVVYTGATDVKVYSDVNSVGQMDQNYNETMYDGFGRVSSTTKYGVTGPCTSSTSTTSYDALGRVSQVTNPACQNYAIGYATKYVYDALGRATQTTKQDGSVASVSYSGNTTVSQDEAGCRRQTVTDALGRLTQVIEDPSSGVACNANNASSHFGYSTTYGYDALDDLTSVSQSGEARTFTYDSLKRLTSATNPESGAISYTYDSNGNVITNTDARGEVTTFTYDELNRVTAKSYSGPVATNAVSYVYCNGASNCTSQQSGGSTVPYSVGRLLAVTNGTSNNYYNAYDPMGRVTATAQQTNGQTYSFVYGYNLAGALTSETYPSGRVVTTTFDEANEASTVAGTLSGQVTNYITQTNYWPHGGLYFYNRGNNVTHAVSYNKRLQQSESYDALNNSTSSMLFVSCPNWGDTSNPWVYDLCPHPAQANGNGNLLSYDEYHGGAGYSQFLHLNQTFKYDNLNRLTLISDSGSYSQSFSYDAYGNMWESSSGLGTNNQRPTSNVYNFNNQIVSPIPQSGGQNTNQQSLSGDTYVCLNTNSGTIPCYDAAGNQTAIPTVPGATQSYDAESRITQVSGSGTTTYSYDGDGRRVIKSTGTATNVYVYDASGELAAEYDSTPQSSPCSTCYLATDHLGTTRIVMDASGKVVSRHDFVPFGEEIPANTAGRDAHFGANNDTIAQKFTGKERDSESGLDYFGARYYGSALGRFTSPDQPFNDWDTDDPQSWNLYGYVRNNPLGILIRSGWIASLRARSGNTLTVTTARGGSSDTCSGTYVNGTVDTNSYAYNNGTLFWSDNSANAGGAMTIVTGSGKSVDNDWGPGSDNMPGAAQIGQYGPVGNAFQRRSFAAICSAFMH